MRPSRWQNHILDTRAMRFGPRMKLAASCVMILLAMLIAAGLLVALGASTGPRNLMLGVALACAPVPFYIAITLWLDRFEAEPLWMLLTCFIWGATAAALIAVAANRYLVALVTALLPHADPHIVWVMATAPAAEELAKGAILLLLFWWNHDEFDGVLDGIIYATMTGLGFAMTENVVYYTIALMERGSAGLTDTLVLRGVIFPFQHPFFTSFLGIALGWAAVTRIPAVKRYAIPTGLTLAIVLHIIWNLSTIHRHFFIAAYLLVGVPVMLGVLILVLISLRSEANVITTQLQIDVHTGRLSPAEHRRLARIRRRMMHDVRSLIAKGPAGLWHSLHFHQVATELAFYRHHTSTGRLAHDPAREAACLARMKQLRPLAALPTQDHPGDDEPLFFDI